MGEEGASIVYFLKLDAERREFFKRELEAAVKTAEELKERWPIEDRSPYMLSWVISDVAIAGRGNKRVSVMATSHLWQLAETHALFGWSDVTVPRVSLRGRSRSFAPTPFLTDSTRRSKGALGAGGLRCWASRRRAETASSGGLLSAGAK